MNISEVTHSQLVEAVTLEYDEKSPNFIRRAGNWKNTDIKDAKRHQGIVYFITINDEIVKIGGSSGNISQLVSQYILNLRSKGEPRENRFCLYLRILSHIVAGDVVKYHFIPVESMFCQFEGLTGKTIHAYHKEFRIIESALIGQYYDIHGRVPIWNNSEGKIGWPEELIALFDKREYALKSGDNDIFDYEEFIAGVDTSCQLSYN